ncbi:MAG TPA: hypothetical protein PLG94_14310 [Smithellaceae bacterium]|nr:hypothetical protein [Smithellaceae bacterium]
MIDTEKIDKLTSADQDRRRLLAHFYAILPEPDRVEAHRLAGELVCADRGKVKLDEYYFYSALLRALNQMYALRHELMHRKASITDEQAAEVATKRLSSFRSAKADATAKKRRKKAQLVSIRFLSLIKKLRSEGLSWRDCADYLQKYHQKKISHQYLKEIYEKNVTKEESKNEK